MFRAWICQDRVTNLKRMWCAVVFFEAAALRGWWDVILNEKDISCGDFQHQNTHLAASAGSMRCRLMDPCNEALKHHTITYGLLFIWQQNLQKCQCLMLTMGRSINVSKDVLLWERLKAVVGIMGYILVCIYCTVKHIQYYLTGMSLNLYYC